MVKKLKTNLKIIIASVVTILISVSSCYVLAQSLIDSKDVYYKDNSGLLADNVQDAIDGTCTKFESKVDNFLDKIYPVGSVYISTTLETAEKVKEALGGEWEAYGAGRTLIGVGNNGTSNYTIGKTGGVENVSTKIKEENLPSHTHTIPELSGTTSSDGAHTPSGTVGWKNLTGVFFDIAYQAANSMGGAYGIISKININDGGVYPTTTGNVANADGFSINASHNHTFTGTSVPNHSHTVSTASSTTTTCNNCKGTALSISTIQPYITVYMYKRTK